MIDVIMLSKGDSQQKKMMTQRAISSLLKEDDMNIYCVETIPGVKYNGADMVYPCEKFNYNKFTKLGYKNCTSDYILFINNDIIAHRNSIFYLLKGLEKYPVVCPSNPRWGEHHRLKDEYTEGYAIWQPSIFQGWCFMMRKQTIDEIGIDKLFPDEIYGWYSDNAVTDILKSRGLKAALVRSAKIEHLQSVTLKTLNKEDMEFYTHGQRENYDKLLGSIE